MRRSPKGKNTRDATGKVRVIVSLAARAGAWHTKGNIIRSFTVEKGRVSKVVRELMAAMNNGAAKTHRADAAPTTTAASMPDINVGDAWTKDC